MTQFSDAQITEIARRAAAEALLRTEARDDEARGTAREALQTIQSHERVCAERAKNADQYREAIKAKVDRLEQMLWATLVSIVVGLLGIIGAILWQKLFA